MFECTIGGVKVNWFYFSAVFGFHQCLLSGHYDDCTDIYLVYQVLESTDQIAP